MSDAQDEIKYMLINEFIDEGYLQEVNRLILHPAGLALSVHRSSGDSTTVRIWDYRDDPEGMIFGNEVIDHEKTEKVRTEVLKHTAARKKLMGTVVQTYNTKIKEQ